MHITTTLLSVSKAPTKDRADSVKVYSSPRPCPRGPPCPHRPCTAGQHGSLPALSLRAPHSGCWSISRSSTWGTLPSGAPPAGPHLLPLLARSLVGWGAAVTVLDGGVGPRSQESLHHSLVALRTLQRARSGTTPGEPRGAAEWRRPRWSRLHWHRRRGGAGEERLGWRVVGQL